MKYRYLVLAAGTYLLLAVAWSVTGRITPLHPETGAIIQGQFPRDGQYPGELLAQAHGVRAWGSWAGSDENRGSLTLGPFPAPARLRIAVGGYPARKDNEIFVEHLATETRFAIEEPDVGERWRIVDVEIPATWVGQSISLIAIDASHGSGGWLAITEPLRGGRGAGSAALVETLATWAISGLILGLLWFGAQRWLARRAWIAAHWIPLVASAFVAGGGYLTFWAYFANASVGKTVSVALLLLGLIVALCKERGSPAPDREQTAVTKLLVCVGLFYLALLHLFPSSREFYNLASNRFIENLPGDNTLPHNLAEILFRGNSPRSPDADWLSSDRPPLQSGWQLITWPVTAALGFDQRTASGTSSVWFQLLWIPAVYGLLRSFGLAQPRASAWVVVMALSGFFLQNSVFTWPKLSAAALVCGTFALWVLPVPASHRRANLLIGAALAALAWLSHGGVAFSLLALVPWLLWRAARGEAREWILAGGLFLVFALPWTAYQKFYDPPGNRLLKWHLADQIAKDPRGTWETIRDSYRAVTPAQILASKAANFRNQIQGNWHQLVDFSAATSGSRRGNEFYYPACALTWWQLGIVLLPVVFARRVPRSRLLATGRAHAALALWIALAISATCLLIFKGGQAVIHQGSYAVMLGLFVLLSVWLELAGTWWVVGIALLQSVSLVTTWTRSNAAVHGPPNGLALGLALVAAAGFVVLIVSAFRPALRLKSPAAIEPTTSSNVCD